MTIPLDEEDEQWINYAKVGMFKTNAELVESMPSQSGSESGEPETPELPSESDHR